MLHSVCPIKSKRTIQQNRWRRDLDARLAANTLRNLGDLGHEGWVREIREALGMTSGQLAHRMGVSQPAVAQLERSEVQGRVQLGTLRRAADALGCELVYALVPRTSIERIRDDRATELAGNAFADDTGDPEVRRARVQHYAARLLVQTDLWAESHAGG